MGSNLIIVMRWSGSKLFRMSKILVIDDDLDWHAFLFRLLKLHGHEVHMLNGADKLIPALDQFAPDLVITDIMMPGVSGSGVQAQIRKHAGNSLPILVCSSTKMKVKSDDPRLVHVTKQDAPEHIIPTIAVMLEESGNNLR